MMRAILKMISKESAPLARLNAALVRLQEAEAKAVADLDASRQDMAAAAQALAVNNGDAAALSDRALAGQASAEQALQTINKQIEAMRGEIAAEQARQSAAALSRRWEATRTLCQERERAAERLQRALADAGKAWEEMADATAAIGRVLPSNKPWSVLNAWGDGTHAAADGYLRAASNGGLGDREALGVLTVTEYHRRLESGETLDVVREVERQHRQVLPSEISRAA
jgi:hypothetical protein